jgi:hypothetical protein
MNPPDSLPGATTSNGWNEWSRYVLSELKRLNLVVEELRKEVATGNSDTKSAIATLNAKSGLVGFIGGMVPAIVVLIYFLVGK